MVMPLMFMYLGWLNYLCFVAPLSQKWQEKSAESTGLPFFWWSKLRFPVDVRVKQIIET